MKKKIVPTHCALKITAINLCWWKTLKHVQSYRVISHTKPHQCRHKACPHDVSVAYLLIHCHHKSPLILGSQLDRWCSYPLSSLCSFYTYYSFRWHLLLTDISDNKYYNGIVMPISDLTCPLIIITSPLHYPYHICRDIMIANLPSYWRKAHCTAIIHCSIIIAISYHVMFSDNTHL